MRMNYTITWLIGNRIFIIDTVYLIGLFTFFCCFLRQLWYNVLSGCVIDSRMVNTGKDYNKTKLDTGKGMVIGSIFYIVII